MVRRSRTIRADSFFCESLEKMRGRMEKELGITVSTPEATAKLKPIIDEMDINVFLGKRKGKKVGFIWEI